ncbi:CHASE2 domain-containing protein [Phormidesmis sp. 146-35]
MSKLVTLKIRSVGIEQGYIVDLEVSQEYASTNVPRLFQREVAVAGTLPSAAKILQAYEDWQHRYQMLNLRHRLEPEAGQVTNVSFTSLASECQRAAQQFQTCFDRWLKSDAFHPIREKLFATVGADEDVRFVMQIEDIQLQRLPWHLSDVFERYEQTEVVLSSPNYEPPLASTNPQSSVRILAILGNSQGINVQKDRAILKELPNVVVKFLVEPQRQELNEQLWKQEWDILFFAGHSSSAGETGKIFINQTDSLTIKELKYGLKNAISNGLKIAIFNSCDGLGLARSLSDLKIPQVIVMREPVPDLVAQEFLKAFLELYSSGHSFYQSVRKARERLQGIEGDFPCATWLPTIYQHLMAQPFLWKQLPSDSGKKKRHLKTAILATCLTTLAIAATRFLGLLQPLELSVFDQTLRSRPSESIDSKLLVIKVTPEDTKRQREQAQSSSLSDASLNLLLQKLQQHQPNIIGIDNYLDHRIDPKYTSIRGHLKSGNLVAVCKTEGAKNEPESKPPDDSTLFGFGDTIADDDRTLRRHLLSIEARPEALCNTPFALSFILANQYLDSKGIKLEITSTALQLGKNQYSFLTKHTGGFQQFDDRGYQILLNYRFNNSVIDAIPSLSLKEVLDMPAEKLKQRVKDKLILIGTTDKTYGDIAKTPYQPGNSDRCDVEFDAQCISGVFLQAQMTSQLISAGLENRHLIWALPFWADSLIVLLFSATGALLLWKIRNRWILLGLAGSAIVLVWSGSVWLLTIGYWFPIVPSVLGLVVAGTCVKIYLIGETKLRSAHSEPLVLAPRRANP